MRLHHGVGRGALGLLLCSCFASQPSWYPGTPARHRESAYDWFFVATGSGDGENRETSCDRAASAAWTAIARLFTEEVESQSDIVAVAGGPSRVPAMLAAYLERVLTDAVRTEEEYVDSSRRCYVELRWRLPRHLASSISRTLELRDTEESVGAAIKEALLPEDALVAPQKAASPTPEAAVVATYRGWFMRLLEAPDCETHRIAFVGAPGGSEARWLELKKVESGWILIDDRSIGDEGWPAPPEISLCD